MLLHFYGMKLGGGGQRCSNEIYHNSQLDAGQPNTYRNTVTSDPSVVTFLPCSHSLYIINITPFHIFLKAGLGLPAKKMTVIMVISLNKLLEL